MYESNATVSAKLLLPDPLLCCVTLFVSGFLCTVVVGHSEDPVRNHAATDEMQINQFQYQMTSGAVG